MYNKAIFSFFFLLLLYEIYYLAFRFTNNVLSTAQQVWLRKLGGAKPVVSENASGIITAGQAKRSGSQPVQSGDRFVSYLIECMLILLTPGKVSYLEKM